MDWFLYDNSLRHERVNVPYANFSVRMYAYMTNPFLELIGILENPLNCIISYTIK